jgi:hypothetical protein
MTIKKYISAAIVVVSALGVAAGFVLAPVLASAQTTPSPTPSSAWGSHSRQGGRDGMIGDRMGMSGVVGTVTAISGDTLTISGKQGFASSTPSTVTYTVNATNATVKKNNATSTLASIAVGDTIVARGTVSGTSVTATSIFDGIMSMTRGDHGGQDMGDTASSTRPTSLPSPITGNGQPVIAGSVSAVNGNTLTITNKSNVTYTVDVTNAKIVQGHTTVTVANVAVGDNVIIQGAVSGTSVTASSVIDQKANVNNGQSPTGTSGGTSPSPAPRGGIFGEIGSFFSHIFGF